ncbi:TPA: hypothetical protein DIC38_00820 [Candidatus Nomurabacteria bacterium]|nr:MAG: hypothetical protein O210_OD1C00001G0563 [Parcubacteria bacterium RAAC4_OD1_1]HCY26214.1 hypothetical protein [Candidatus Nomurabacteria bacterium]
MQNQELQQKIGEFYVRLPEDLKSVFSDMSWMEKVRTIGVKNYLNDRQKEILITETTLVLLGIINTYDYESNLTNELGLSVEPLTKLIKDLDESIFVGIKEKLNDVFTNNVDYLMTSKYGSLDKIKEEFTKLPEEIQEWIDNSNYQSKIYEIGEKYKLTATQMLDIEGIISRVMMGNLPFLKYEEEIKLKLGDGFPKINPILYEIKENILKEAEEKLNKLTVLNKIGATKIEINKGEDVVPRPPYAQMITNNYDLKGERVNNVRSSILVSKPAPKNEKEIYTNSGIEIVEHQEETQSKPKIDPYHEEI